VLTPDETLPADFFSCGSAEFYPFTVTVDPTITDAELIGLMKLALEMRARGAKFIRAVIEGFEHDPRPVLKIPEIRALCQRLVDIGFIAVLELSDPFPESPPLQRYRRDGGTEEFGAGALEVWMLAKRPFGEGPFKINKRLVAKGEFTWEAFNVGKEVIDAFLADMAAAGKACQRVTGVCPWPRPQANRN
jgi:hypothetical protein